MSAQCNLAGLYPPSGEQIWRPDLMWQPIPIHTIPLDDDYLLWPLASCPRHTQLFDQYMNSVEMKSIMQRHKSYIDFLQQKSGLKNMTLVDLALLYDTLFVQNLKGFA